MELNKKWRVLNNKKRLNQLTKAAMLIESDVIEYMNDNNIYQHGEGIFLDETECWKRVLQQRLSNYYKPKTLIETHKGKGIGSFIYKKNNPILHSCEYDYESELKNINSFNCDLIDIDPYGFCYDAIKNTKRFFYEKTILCVTSGEIMTVARNLKNNKVKTGHYGKNTAEWIPYFINEIEILTEMKCHFFYASEVIIRLFLSKIELEKSLFNDCPQYMGWLQKYNNV
jgi:hypothetical protein